MSLGVLNNVNATYAENNLNSTSSSLSKVLQQLSSGSKINSGSDDAAGLSLVNGLQANQQALTQSSTNATEGVGLLQVADGALSQVTSLLNRAVTLATEASNGTLNTSQLTAANEEYQSILNEVSNIGSTTTYNGQTVFGSTFNIYTGDSTSTGASIDSLTISSLSSSNLGDTKGTVSYKSSATAASTTYDFGSGASGSGTTVAKIGGTATTAGATGTVDYKDASGTSRSFTFTSTNAAGTETLNQLATDITAGGTSAGITATVNSAGKLVLSGGTNGASSISIESGSAITASNGASASGTTATTTYDWSGAGDTKVASVGGTNTLATHSNAVGTVTYTDANGKSQNFTFNVTAGDNATNLATDITNGASAAGVSGITAAYDTTAKTFTLSAGSSGATNLSIQTAISIGSTTPVSTTTGSLETQDNPTAVTAGIATISYTASAGQSLSSTDLSSQSDAKTALTDLNAAISDVAAQDGYIGAQINTLNSVSSVISTQQTNIESAQNAIQATDYATASSNLSKYEILSQTGISALAQANSVQQEVTKLLQ